MPTYDYVCGACGHALEIFQSMSESPKKKCPKCGKSKLERRIGAGAGFLFKGSGFYLTDYRSKSYTEGAQTARSEAERHEGTSAAPASDSSSTPSEAAAPKAAPKTDAPSKATPKPAPSKKKPSRGD